MLETQKLSCKKVGGGAYIRDDASISINTVFVLVYNIMTQRSKFLMMKNVLQACGNVDRFVKGSGMPLAIMAVADLISLLIVFIIIVMSSQAVNHSTWLIHCKVSEQKILLPWQNLQL
jgi:hypothetical protein